MDSAIIRCFLIAPVNHLVNVAMIVGSVRNNLSPAKLGPRCRSISTAALMSAYPDDYSRKLQYFRVVVHKTFYLIFVLC
jgi:hypothetical protein